MSVIPEPNPKETEVAYIALDDNQRIIDYDNAIDKYATQNEITNSNVSDAFPSITQQAPFDISDIQTTEQYTVSLTPSDTITDTAQISVIPITRDNSEIETLITISFSPSQSMIKEKYEELMMNSSDVFLTLDYDWNLTYISPAIEKMTGNKPSELHGEHALQFVHTDDKQKVRDNLKQSQSNPDTKQRIEFRVITTDIEVIWLEAIFWTTTDDLFDETIIINARNITERKQRQQKLETQHQQLSILFDKTPEPIFYYEYENEDTHPIIKQVNDSFVDVFGYKRNEIIGQPVTKIVPSKFKEESEEIANIVKDGTIIDREVKRKTKHGIKHFKFRAIPNEQDNADSGYAVYDDITDRIKREQKITSINKDLEQQRQRFISLFREFPEPTLTYQFNSDDEPIIQSVNESFKAVFGYSENYAVGKNVNSLLVSRKHKEEAQQIDSRIQDGEQVDREIIRQTADGEKHFAFRHIPTTNDTEIDGFAVYVDITDRVRRAQELQQTNQRLEQFARTVSHDLRNPINIAKGHLDIVRDNPSDEYINTIDESLDRMLTIIEDVLTLARDPDSIEKSTEINIDTVATDAWQSVQTETLSLTVDTNSSLQANETLLSQLFENLYRNAVEHAGDNVTVTVGANPYKNMFYVADDGIGIPEDEHDSIIEPGETTHKDGTGLGLSIIKKIAAVHNWSMKITDSSDGGARFEFYDVNMNP